MRHRWAKAGYDVLFWFLIWTKTALISFPFYLFNLYSSTPKHLQLVCAWTCVAGDILKPGLIALRTWRFFSPFFFLSHACYTDTRTHSNTRVVKKHSRSDRWHFRLGLACVKGWGFFFGYFCNVTSQVLPLNVHSLTHTHTITHKHTNL